MIEIRTLGELAILVDGEHVHLPTRKQYALLVFLGCNPDRVFQREQLAMLLWDGYPIRDARHSLSECISKIRRRIPSLNIETKGQLVWLPEGSVRVDAMEFRRAADGNDILAASRMYVGDFLEGFWVRDARAFEVWQEEERQFLMRMADRVIRRHVEELEEGADWQEVERQCDRLIRLDRYDEAIHRKRIRAIALGGDRRRAISELHQLIETIESDLGRSAEAETIALLKWIEDGSFNTGRPVVEYQQVERTPFIGRRKEFKQAKDEWERVTRGTSSVMAISGKAGIGKTRFCEEVLRLAAVYGARVIHGRCFESERQIPLSGLLHALKSDLRPQEIDSLPVLWRHAVVELLTGTVPAETVHHSETTLNWRHRVFEGITRVIEIVSNNQPVVIAIDDIQWADESTMALLHYAARRFVQHPVMIVVTARQEDLREDERLREYFSSLLSCANNLHIQLGELDEASAHELIASIEMAQGISLPEQVRDVILKSTGGRPFLLIEVLNAVMNGADFESADAMCGHPMSGSPVAYPTSVDEYLSRLLRGLSDDALLIAKFLAVIGTKAQAELLKNIVDLSYPSFVRGVNELARRGVIVSCVGALQFSHDLMRQFFYRSLGDIDRQLLHARVADVLSQEERPKAAVLAFHYHVAGKRARAFRYGLQAARESARMHAYDESDFYYRVAMDCADSDTDVSEIIEEFAYRLYRRGRYNDADSLYSSAVAMRTGINGSGAAELNRIVRAFREGSITVAELTERLVVLAAGLEDKGETTYLAPIYRMIAISAHDLGSRSYALLSARKLITYHTEGDPIDGIISLAVAGTMLGLYRTAIMGLRVSEAAVKRAEIEGDPEVILRALKARATNHLQLGNLESALDDLDRAQCIARDYGLDADGAHVELVRVVVLLEAGDYGAVREILTRLMARDPMDENDHVRLIAAGNFVLLDYEQHGVGEASKSADNLLLINRSFKNRWCDMTAWAILGLCALEYRRMDEVRRCREKVLAHFEGRELWAADASYAEIFLSRAYEREGEVGRALERLDGAIAAYANRDVFCRSRLRLERARLMAARDPEFAWREAGEVREFASRVGARPLVEKADGILDGLPAFR